MKKVIIHSSALALISALASETNAYLNNWRPLFFNYAELLNILCFSVFAFIPIAASYLAILKIVNEKQILTLPVRMIIVAFSLAVSITILYYDDDNGFEKLLSFGSILGILVLSIILFIIGCGSFLLIKKNGSKKY
jgi:hypothetical protein